jgi:hypothetical protein
MTSSNPPCPAALNIMGQHFPCRQMEQMVEGSTSHEGWAHSNPDAEAIWSGSDTHLPTSPKENARA